MSGECEGEGDCALLFVYGTLRYDSADAMACYLRSVSRFLGRVSTSGRLYDLGRYPGMTAAAEPAERVWGHLFELQEPATTLMRLDEYEGCPFGEPIPALFQRQVIEVVGPSGEARRAWCYTYHGEVTAQMRLAGGEFTSPAGAPTG
jgi:gamma-glutamylcyclotransferase (GGCT)/AIG2-like uncharacterized protein YtfP